MGLFNLFPGKENKREENLRSIARELLQRIVELESKIERYEEALRNAERYGNDPRVIRTDITATEIQKLDIERQLEKIDQEIVRKEKTKVERMRGAA